MKILTYFWYQVIHQGQILLEGEGSLMRMSKPDYYADWQDARRQQFRVVLGLIAKEVTGWCFQAKPNHCLDCLIRVHNFGEYKLEFISNIDGSLAGLRIDDVWVNLTHRG